MIDISFITVTELAQIDRTEAGSTKGDPSTIKIKEQKVLTRDENGIEKILITPYYTGNGFRGKLRRACTKLLLEKSVEKGLSLKKAEMSFHLMNAGGGNLHGQQPFDIEDKARIMNPVVSVFGASLAIKGKIAISNLMPIKNYHDGEIEYYGFTSSRGNFISSIKWSNISTKVDNLLDRSGNAIYMPEEALKEWHESVKSNIKAVSNSINNVDKDEKKVKKETIRGRFARDWIIRGVNFKGSIQAIMPLTEIERGMLYRAIEEMVLENLGSNASNNFGCVNYSLVYDDGSRLETKTNEFFKSSISNKIYSEDIKKSIAAFDKYLDDLTLENIRIEDILLIKK